MSGLSLNLSLKPVTGAQRQKWRHLMLEKGGAIVDYWHVDKGVCRNSSSSIPIWYTRGTGGRVVRAPTVKEYLYAASGHLIYCMLHVATNAVSVAHVYKPDY